MSNKQELELLQLPTEIIVRILKFVPRKASLYETNKQLKDICDENFRDKLLINNKMVRISFSILFVHPYIYKIMCVLSFLRKTGAFRSETAKSGRS